MNDSNDITSGTAAGLLTFLDYLVENGYGAQSTIGPWKSASRQVLEAMEGPDFEATRVTEIDPDEYLSRFETRERGNYKIESLRAYRSRFTRAITAYRQFLEDGSIPRLRASPGTRGRKEPASERRSGTQAIQAVARTDSEGGKLIDYPFPLRSGNLAQLRLPARLERADAERIAAFVRTLVFEPQEQPADKPEDASEAE